MFLEFFSIYSQTISFDILTWTLGSRFCTFLPPFFTIHPMSFLSHLTPTVTAKNVNRFWGTAPLFYIDFQKLSKYSYSAMAQERLVVHKKIHTYMQWGEILLNRFIDVNMTIFHDEICNGKVLSAILISKQIARRRQGEIREGWGRP